ncbi:MAG TPA: hypothetical protein VGN17_24985 [Bryobacteraceae bacterium]|jgi:hypothetical protein
MTPHHPLPRTGAVGAVPLRWFAVRENAPFLILALMLGNTAVGILGWIYWRLTGDNGAILAFFRYPNSLLTLLICLIEAGLCWEVWRQFEPGDSFRAGWFWLSLAAVAHLAGRTLSSPGSEEVWVSLGVNLRDAGSVLGGPVQMALLLVGLAQVAWQCRRLGILRKLVSADYLLLAVVSGFGVRTVYGISQYLAAGKPVTWTTLVSWSSDPLLLMLLAVAVLIWRSMAKLGCGLLANCWRSYVIAIALTSLGAASSWCLDCTVTSWWTELGWYVWFLADATYALAAAFQAAALDRVRTRADVLTTIEAR